MHELNTQSMSDTISNLIRWNEITWKFDPPQEPTSTLLLKMQNKLKQSQKNDKREGDLVVFCGSWVKRQLIRMEDNQDN